MVVDPSLKEICAVTEKPAKCVSCLAPFLAGSPTDAVTVLNMFIEAIYKHVERSISLLEKETKKPSQLPVLTTCLDTCIESYDKIKIELVKAEDSCAAHDVDTATALLTATISKFGQCDESFHKNGMGESPMSEIDEILIELVGFAVDVSQKLIQKKH
ncbi:hypothetical protein JCGZ_06267 [Jatropha curcas]|uniref:Pectinesterase inhibitor domain-containing protein n=1 Tax=Jatropha curcas TaxID=180498 RepID=A0A067KLX8_JATCU|nr:hypothetical protein JCGZ_06267 [Jatropha curcas]